MNSLQALHLLKHHDLLPQAKLASQKLKSVLVNCLDADLEDILIIADSGAKNSSLSAILGAGYYFAAQELDLSATLVLQPQKAKGREADRQVEEALDQSGFRNIIIMTAHALGSTPKIGKSFRRFAKARRHKYISCTGLGSLTNDSLPSVLRAIDIDYTTLQMKALLLKERLEQAKELRVTTTAGTDLWLKTHGVVHVNDGRFHFPGTGGNLPAGEVYLAPAQKKVEGRIVIDGSSRHIKGTSLVKTPITLTVKKGEVTEITGGREAELLEKSISWALEKSTYPWGVKRISEFGLGLNPRAQLIGAMIVDEKTVNTAHIALGSNYWFGGTVYAIIHLDQVFKNPTIELDGEILDRKLYC